MRDINKINILNKEGFLTDSDRKKSLNHQCEHFIFESCIDLSVPVKVTPYGYDANKLKKYSVDSYSQDVSSFICWWTNNVMKDLNGFSGFRSVKFELIGFEII